MEPIESSETSAYNSTLTPGTYPKEKKLQSKHGESLKSRMRIKLFVQQTAIKEPYFMNKAYSAQLVQSFEVSEREKHNNRR